MQRKRTREKKRKRIEKEAKMAIDTGVENFPVSPLRVRPQNFRYVRAKLVHGTGQEHNKQDGGSE